MSVNNEDDETILLKENKHNKDKYNLVYLIVFFTGIGVLMPWNFFITVKPYFMFKLSNGTDSETITPLQYMFENYLSMAAMIPIAITNIVNLFLRRYITPMKRFSVGISIMFLVFLVTLVLTKIPTSTQQIPFFIVTMISVVILNVCSGIIQGSSMGIISMMPGRYIKGFMEGQAISGLLAAIANIISIAVVSSPDSSAFMYFLVALVFLIITALGFCRLGNMKFSKSYVEISNQMDLEVHDSDDLSNTNDSIPNSFTGNRQSFTNKYIPLVKKTYWHGLTTTMSFLVTLSLFPAISTQIETVYDNPQWKKYFTPVTCFFLFNLADYLGRVLCGYVKIPSVKYPRLLFLVSTLRWIFVPLFFMCNISTRKHFPKVLDHDAYAIVLTFLLGLSNGYFLTLALIYAPSLVEDKEKEAVGTLMSLFLCFGLAFGVLISLGYIYII